MNYPCLCFYIVKSSEKRKQVMQIPNVITEVKDKKKNFTFRVRAYRKLTEQELRAAFIIWNRQRDKRRSFKNKIIEITSIIGYNE